MRCRQADAAAIRRGRPDTGISWLPPFTAARRRHVAHGLLHFLRAHVAPMRGDRPAAAERVFELAVAIAPEPVLPRHRVLGSRLTRGQRQTLHHLTVQINRYRRATKRLQPAQSPSWKYLNHKPAR